MSYNKQLEKYLKIRSQYKHPRVYSIDREGDPKLDNSYCVGGACSLYTKSQTRPAFPDDDRLSNHLRKINKKLSADKSWICANAIINANDQENFSGAWQILKLAILDGWEK